LSRLTEIREALRDLLPDDDGETFAAEVLTGRQAEQETFKGRMGPPQMVIRVYVGDPADKEAQARLDRFLDDEEEGSVADRLYHGDQKLGGLVRGLRIVSASGWRIYPTKDGQLLGAEWVVQTR
jgi:putative component of toxin-antitoxin plasmid stabilization module